MSNCSICYTLVEMKLVESASHLLDQARCLPKKCVRPHSASGHGDKKVKYRTITAVTPLVAKCRTVEPTKQPRLQCLFPFSRNVLKLLVPMLVALVPGACVEEAL